MARFKKNILGDVRGKIGDKVYKEKDGTEYVASVPEQYTMSDSPAAVANYNKMIVRGKFSKMVNDVGLLKEVWRITVIKGYDKSSAFNKISGVNSKFILPGKATENNIITPGGFGLKIKDIKCLGNKVEIKLKDIPKKRGENKFACMLLIWCEEPEKTEEDKYSNESILKEMETTGKKIIFETDENIMMKISKYTYRIIYFALIAVDNEGRPMRWSSTFAKKME